MNKRQQLYYLLESFLKNEYEIQSFCDAFEKIFYPSIPGNELTPDELKLFEALGEIVTRYTPFAEDLENYPGVYKSGTDVKNAIYTIADKLKGTEALHPF